MTQTKDKAEHQDDPALIEAARRDPDAFAALYQRYLTPLYRYLLQRLNNVHDAEDLTTQVFIETLDALINDRYREGGCFPAWLFTVARRRVVDFYRRRSCTALEDIPAAEPGLQTAVEKGEDLQRLGCLLARLNEEQRELLRLRFSAKLSFAEMGLIDGRSEAAVKMALYRTLDFLRTHWEDENE